MIAAARRASTALLVLALAAPAHSATVDAFSPQGEVKGVRQVAARFSAQIVPFGDPRLIEPFDVTCPGKGTGRWADGRNWIYDFARDLPAGVVCTFSVKSGLKTLAGESVDAAKFSFTTGGPAVKRATPYEGASVDEEQVFILALDAPATDASIEAQAYCAVEGIGERIGVRVLKGDEKAKILANRNLLGDRFYQLLFKNLRGDTQALVARVKDPKSALPVAVVQCHRPLPNGAALQLVWGKGVATPNGIGTSQDQKLAFRVRPAFSATFQCTRVNAQAPCVPIAPLDLAFSAPVARKDAARVLLRTEDGGTYAAAKLPDGDSPYVTGVRFVGPLPERMRFRVEVPSNLKDDAGRRLANAASFPLAVATDDAPPLAKFPARFGIIEANAGAMLPVTLRNLEPEVAGRVAGPDGIPGSVAALQDDAAIIEWTKRLNQVRSRTLRTARGTYLAREGEVSVFEDGRLATRRITVPKPGGPREFEVVGIPLERTGFYVVELASPRLGAALHGEPKPYFVQTAALVTNLAAHLKWGGDASIAWVTTLDQAQPVAGAEVAVRDCNGRALWSGKTDADGVAAINQPIGSRRTLPHCTHFPAELFVSVRHGADLAFVLSSWDEGIQPWQFNLPTGSYEGRARAHAVLDRSLLRAGETVGMKLFLREQTMEGFAVPDAKARPAKAVIEHQGTDQRYEVPVTWDATGTAEASWSIPKDAKLGAYRVLVDRRPDSLDSGAFRVEEFRVPTLKAVIQPPREPLVNPRQAHVDLLLSYLSGGGAGNAPVKLRTQVQPRGLSYPDYPDFGFGGADVKEGKEDRRSYADVESDDEEADATPSATQPGKLAQVLPLTLDAAGAARATLDKLPAITAPQDLLVEMEYQDANGETASASARVPLWPAKINLGIRTEGWVAARNAVRFQVLALDLRGKPVANTEINVDLFQRKFYSHRKRLIGGFYAYEDWSETTRLGAGCAGRTDARGLVVCSLKTAISGEIILRARAGDGAGNTTVASRSVYVVGADRQWFRLGDNDRIDLLPEKKRYEPGETARFQVRMPFRDATALVTIEREGVIDRRVVRLSGREPVIEVPLKPEYCPNVFVSVLAVRGRLESPRGGSFSGLGARRARTRRAVRNFRLAAGERRHAADGDWSISPSRPSSSAWRRSTSAGPGTS